MARALRYRHTHRLFVGLLSLVILYVNIPAVTNAQTIPAKQTISLVDSLESEALKKEEEIRSLDEAAKWWANFHLWCVFAVLAATAFAFWTQFSVNGYSDDGERDSGTKPNGIPDGSEHLSERSDADSSIFRQVFGIVKSLSGAKRRKETVGAGIGVGGRGRRLRPLPFSAQDPRARV